ncbi:MAG: TetR/AcrR family transcriptional regulator [Pseudomonadota bacterium]
MPRPALTEEQRKRTRGNIREAAIRLRAKQGSHQISVRDIAAEAGISVGTFYIYYENLDDLAQALWQEPVKDLRLKIESIASETENPLKRIRKVLECYARFEVEQHRVFKGAFLFVRPDTMCKPVPEQLKTEVFYRLLREAIVEGQQIGEIRDGDPGEFAQILWASIHGALAIPINLDRYRFYPSQKMAKKTIRFLLSSLAVDGIS